MLLGLVALPLLYLVPANAVLWTGLIPSLVDGRPDRFDLRYRWAWTIWPGAVHVHGFSLRIQDSNVQFHVGVDSGITHVEFGPLFHRRFQARGVRAEGVTFQLRTKPHSRREAARLRRVQPPIDGLENPVVPPKAAKAPPQAGPPPPPKGLWSVHLNDVVAHDVREIWIDEYRFRGSGRASGGFLLIPKRQVWVHGRLVTGSGNVDLGSGRVAENVDADLEVHLRRFDPRRNPGRDALKQMSADLDLKARLEDLSFLRFYFSRAPWLHLSGGRGSLSGNLSMRAGELVAGSHLEADADAIRASVLGHDATGNGSVRWRVEGEPARGVLHVGLARFVVRGAGEAHPYMRGRRLRIDASTADLALWRPPRSLDVAIDLPHAEIPDLSYYARYLPASSGLDLTGGTARVSAKLAFSSATGITRGSLGLSCDGVTATHQNLALEGGLDLTTRVSSSSTKLAELSLAGTTLSLHDVALRGHRLGIRERRGGWWADATLGDGSRILPGRDRYLTATVKTHMRDSGPLIAFFASRSRLPGPVQDALTVSDLTGEATVSLGADRTDIDPVQVDGRDLTLLGRLRLAGKTRRGVFYLRRGPLSFGLELGDETKIRLTHPKEWYQRYPPLDSAE